MFQNVRLYILIILHTLAIMILKEFKWSYCVISEILAQIDSKLKFHIHTDTVVKKAYRVLA